MPRIKAYSRYELKYVINETQRQQLAAALVDYMRPDAMGDQYGRLQSLLGQN